MNFYLTKVLITASSRVPVISRQRACTFVRASAARQANISQTLVRVVACRIISHSIDAFRPGPVLRHITIALASCVCGRTRATSSTSARAQQIQPVIALVHAIARIAVRLISHLMKIGLKLKNKTKSLINSKEKLTTSRICGFPVCARRVALTDTSC